jgi:hypothetical protein
MHGPVHLLHVNVAATCGEDRFAAYVIRTDRATARDAPDVTADFAERDIAARVLALTSATWSMFTGRRRSRP